MKITEIYIENFGKLSKQHYRLQGNITQLLEHNGFGKTTFSAFLKAMFYGMPSVRQNAKDFNDREHYAPFNGGKFGGNIHFIYKNKNFILERFFDRKSETKDSIKVYCNGREYTGFKAEIGKELFDLDKEGFEKTTFITAEILDSTTTAEMQAKLGHFMDNTTAEYNFTTAISQLEDAKKQYKYNKGKGGKIYTLECRQQVCYSELDRLNTLADQLEGYYSQYNALKVELEQAIESIETVSKTELYWERYTEYQNKIQYLEEKLQVLQAEYKNGLPTSEEFATLRTYANRLLQLETASMQQNFSSEKLEKLKTMQSRFANYPFIAKNTALQDRNLQNINGTDTLNFLDSTLDTKLQEIKNLIAKWTEKQAELAAYTNTIAHSPTSAENISTPSSITTHNKHASPTPYKSKIIAITRILFFIIGITFIVITPFVPKNIGFYLLFSGILLFFSAIVWTTFGNKQNAKTTLKNNSTQEKMPLSTDNKLDTAPQQNIDNYIDKIDELKRECAEYAFQLKEFFGYFGYTDDNYLQNYTNLHIAIKEYQNLQQEYENTVLATQKVDSEIIDIKEKVYTLLQRYDIAIQKDFFMQLEELQNKAKDLEALQLQKNREQAEAKNYYIKHNLADMQRPNNAANIENYLSNDSISDTSNISYNKSYAITLEEKQQQFASLGNHIAEIEQQLLLYSNYENELEEIENQLKICKEEYSLLSATIEYLQQAEENLKIKYLRPLQSKLDNYNLKEMLGIDIHLDANLNLTFESAGERHTSKYLSTGQRTLCLFVLRLALIDSLFHKDKPLLILDDPFVNLDAKHIQSCNAILKTLAKDRQILYFCCHSSRSIIE